MNGVPAAWLEVFRIGDFYEAFDADARRLAAICGLALTTRTLAGKELAMTGFPYHQLEAYKIKCSASGSPLVVLGLDEAREKYLGKKWYA